MIDEKKLIEEISNLYNEYANDQTRFEREETKAIYRFIGALTCRIENMPKVNKWILVEERLPEENERVLVTYLEYKNNKPLCDVAYIDEYGDWVWDFDESDVWNEIIAWMPLPKKYEKE